ncbi:general L-amino acid transport system permease protein [Maritalea mobilis]|uniref:General L-amino acid transport system permease protein n=1 Tax=Maritalea mobilis TaxID=483324 RepID=A0A4R6VUB9_9HYPH|nr:ABC transporter permease subunit [Maritalea mobilis]TDQ67071.1 general L-amino acid transport system permease protein [Maritalea mobilis]
MSINRQTKSAQATSWSSLFYDERVRAILYQVLAVVGVALVAYFLWFNAATNLRQQNIASGFDYLGLEAGFEISDRLIEFSPADSYARALLVGLLNTIYVSLLACVLCTFLGTFIGVLRLSPNPLLSKLMLIYVEIMRNIPLLLHLFFWYTIIVFIFPPVREALQLAPGVYISNGGFYVPVLEWSFDHTMLLITLIASMVVAYFTNKWAIQKRIKTGEKVRIWPVHLAIITLPLALAYFLFTPEFNWNFPELGRFRFSGGGRITAEFAALLIGLTLTATANVAEIVRSGIQSVNKGQWEAARSLGLKGNRVMKSVILPQALRVIIPPLTSNYLNVTKNSTLAIAIGYPDLVMVSNTTMNQTGQAIEGIAIFMAVYLGLSLLTSVAMNWYNGRVALKGR